MSGEGHVHRDRAAAFYAVSELAERNLDADEFVDCPACLSVQERLKEGRRLIEDMDRLMPEQAATDEDDWIVNYRIPVGPWHRLLAWARMGSYAARASLEAREALRGLLSVTRVNHMGPKWDSDAHRRRPFTCPTCAAVDAADAALAMRPSPEKGET